MENIKNNQMVIPLVMIYPLIQPASRLPSHETVLFIQITPAAYLYLEIHQKC
jgi:hypothetical protein